MIFFRNTKGETIAETVIALTVLSIGIALSSALMANSLRNINTSKERVIATNIAREGLEAVRNIRDTNWLKFSGKRRQCWNHMPAALLNDVCADNGSDWIQPGTYIVYRDEDFRWRLKAVGQLTGQKRWLPSDFLPNPPADTPADFDASLLFTMDIDETADSDNSCYAVPRPANCLTDDADIFNPKIHYQNMPTAPAVNDVLGRALAKPTPFNRLIKIDYLTNDGTFVANGALADAHNRMLVTSTVTWGGQEKGVELKTILTDYFGRENLTN
ncbi:hypothetical protein JXA05_02970 [Candidatus Peregrinibacteria bacterium]|nr:hypothetical protein [Candidatus Peregrinibacteria bacterium]